MDDAPDDVSGLNLGADTYFPQYRRENADIVP